MLVWVLMQRKARDGRKQCFKSSVKEESGWADVFCTEADQGVDRGEDPPEGTTVFLTLHYDKVPAPAGLPCVQCDGALASVSMCC